MSGVFGYSREAVRVKVKKSEGNMPPEFRKFSVDPGITSFEVLQSILAKAFDLKGDFAIYYRVFDASGFETYIPLLSDYDLDAAFLKAHNLSLASSSEPCLCLKVELKPFEECSDDWEVKQNVTFITHIRNSSQEAKPTPRLHGIFNQVGKTLNLVQRAFNFGEEGSSLIQPPRPHLSDSEFRRFLDPVGQIIFAKELRSVIYFGGIDPSLRRVVWKHLLNVYPDGMTGRERMDYIKHKAAEYVTLRETWKSAITQGPVVGELAYTTGMVKKDVLRTDRHHPFYAGSDDNKNIAALFNILTTYALNHPKVSYCQGMSDLASPLLVTMDDEAHAYICFCALMKRLSTNFMIDGIAMTQKFTHLAEGLMYYDPEFYNYLKLHQADDLLFCYRWLLLEMKREFAFDDSLRMLEILWSSLPSDPPENELKLFDVKYQLSIPQTTPPISPLLKTPRENPYTKVCALRRQSSSISLSNYAGKKAVSVKRQNHSLDETLGRSRNTILEIKLKHQSLDDASLVKQKISNSSNSISPKSPKKCLKKENGSPVLMKKMQNSPRTDLRPRSASPLEQKSDSVILVNRVNSHPPVKSRSANLSSSMTNLIKNKKATHFKDLKDLIAAGKLFSSLDHLDVGTDTGPGKENDNKSAGKIIKNFNEFLNFASANSNKFSNKISRLGSINDNNVVDHPKIMLTKSSFDSSETSSCDQNSLSARARFSSTSNSCEDTFDDSSPDDSQEYFPLTTSVTRELKLELENLDRKVFGERYNEKLIESPSSDGSTEQIIRERNTAKDTRIENNLDIIIGETADEIFDKRKSRGDDIFVWENPLHRASPNVVTETVLSYATTPDEQTDLDFDAEMPTIVNEISAKKTITPIKVININSQTTKEMETAKPEPAVIEERADVDEPSTSLKVESFNGGPITTCEEVTEAIKTSPILPPPNEFGGGNPFLMFLCLTVLLQHRDTIIGKGMDYNEMAMHFDKMVRKHNVTKVLNQARQLYARYIKQHTIAHQRIDPKHEDC